MLTLYYMPGSCARASHIALREAQAEFQLQLVDFASQGQRAPEYLAINPKGRVPALATPDGVVTETPAILTYIAQTHPAAGLAPASPYAFAKMQELNAYLCATVHVAHAHSRRGERWADDADSISAMRAKAPGNMRDCFGLLEQHFVASPWALGEQFTVADPYLFTIAQWLTFHKIDIAEFPRVKAHHDAMLDRPAVQAALEAEA